MAISILAQAVVDKASGGAAAYTHSGFAVPGGTTRLLVLVEYRGFSSGAAPALSSVTHNGTPLSFLAGSATTGGFDDITTWWGQLADPDIGTFDVVATFPSDVRGVKFWILAISGEKASGSILGNSAFQRKAGAVTDTVGLGVTPAASGDSLLLGSLAIAKNTTLTTWTGTGWTAVATNTYTGGGNLTSTSRYQLNAPGGAALTVSAKFGATSTDIGGSLIEILAEPVGTDVSDTFGVTLAVTGSVAGGSSAALTDASFRRRAKWTEMLAFQPDLAGVDRRLIAAGPSAAPNLVVDQIASGSMYRWLYRLTDGTVTVDSAPGSQSVAAQHIALVHGGVDGPALYLNGTLSAGAVTGGDLTGLTDIGAGGETIGSHATGTAYTGLIGRYLLHEDALSAEQVRLLALSQTDPDAIWGSGVEDDAEVANQSPVVLPMVVEPDGRPQITVRPTIIDPNGTGAVLSSVTLPTHGSVVIADKDLVINLEPGWVGRDNFSVTASDGSKSSTAKITINQTRPALLVQGDSIALTESSSTTFDPRSNDVGAGTLRTISASDGAHGTTVVLADGRISFTAGAVTGDTADSFSYTVSDDWGSASATVAVTIRESGTSFVSASNDSIETTVGTAIPIPVLANDTASADNLPLVVQPGSITAPVPSGTAALQPDGQILYTPASGATGDMSFQYTAKPASKPLPTSTATVSVRVVSAATGLPKLPPPATKTWRPATFSAFIDQVNSPDTQPGDHIELGDGVWGNNSDPAVVFTRDFAGAGIVIKGKNVTSGHTPSTAILPNITFDGDGYWMHHLRFMRTPSHFRDYAIFVRGARIRVTRCWINTLCGMNIGGLTATTGIDPARCKDLYFGWNRFCAPLRTGNNQICYMNYEVPGNMPSATAWYKNTNIYRNYWGHFVAKSNDNQYLLHAGDAQASGGDARQMAEFDVTYNFFEVNDIGWDKFVYMKNGYRRFNFNHLQGPAAFLQRHGSIVDAPVAGDNTITTKTITEMFCNKFVNASVVFLNGAGHDLRWNHIEAARGVLLAGGYNRNYGNGAKYQAASHSKLIGNTVRTGGTTPPYRAGWTEEAAGKWVINYKMGGETRDIEVRGHSSLGATPAPTIANMTGFAGLSMPDTWRIFSDLGSYTPLTTVSLTRDKVGFEAAGQEAMT